MAQTTTTEPLTPRQTTKLAAWRELLIQAASDASLADRDDRAQDYANAAGQIAADLYGAGYGVTGAPLPLGE